MLKTWLLACLIANCLLVQGLAAQDPAPIELPEDPYAAIAAMPIAHTQEQGLAVRILDGATKQPIVGANVIAFPDLQGKFFQERRREVQALVGKQKVGREYRQLILALLVGVRYQTNADGIARIPDRPGAYAMIVHNKAVVHWGVGMTDPVLLFGPRFVNVRVTNSSHCDQINDCYSRCTCEGL